MKFSHTVIMLIAGILFCGSLFAQKDTTALISITVQDVTVEKFVVEIEKQTGVHFYYDSTQFDSTSISLVAKDQPLRKVLDQAFANVGAYYTIDNTGHVFLTKGHALSLLLPQGFYSRGKVNKASPAADAALFSGNADTDDDPKSTPKATLENKLYEVGDKSAANQPKVVTMAGYIKDAKTGEPVAGASIYIDNPRIGVSTDQYGYYSLSLPRGRHILNIQSIGMRDTRRQIVLYSDGKMNIDLQGTVIALKKVIISAQKLSNVKGTQMGLQKIDISTIKRVPVVFGEADI